VRLALLLFMHASLVAGLHAQQPADTGMRVIRLQAVQISDGSDSANAAFTFYQAGKLSGTEELLSRMEGVNLIRRGAFGMEPVLRGYSAGQMNTTIDGMRIYGACTDRMDPVSIYVEPVNLQSIQAAHGVGAGTMGSTVGGQINFQMKEPDTSCHRRISGQMAQSWASNNNAFSTSAWVQSSGKAFSVRSGGIYRKAGNYHASSGMEIPWSGYEKINFSTVMVYQINKAQRLRLDFLYDLGRNIGFPALPMDVGKADALIGSISHKVNLKNTFIQAINSRIYMNRVLHQMDDTHRKDVLMHMDMPGLSETFGFYTELQARQKVQIRIDGHRVYSLAEMIMYPKDEPQMYVQTLPANRIYNAGTSFSKDFHLSARNKLRLSARLDYYQIKGFDGSGAAQWEIFGNNIRDPKQYWLKNGSVAWEKTFNANWLGRLSAGYGERIPTASELFGYYLYNRQDQFDYIGNYDIQPESSWQIEYLGRRSFKNGFIQLNLFAHKVQHYIYAMHVQNAGPATPGALGLKTYINIPYAHNLGFEFTGKFTIWEGLESMTSIKYLYTETHQHISLPLTPPMKWQQAIAYRVKSWMFQFEFDLASAQNRINSDFGDRPTPAYQLINLRIARNFVLGRTVLQAGLACENLLDTNYREHLDIGNIPRPGRNLTANLSFRF